MNFIPVVISIVILKKTGTDTRTRTRDTDRRTLLTVTFNEVTCLNVLLWGPVRPLVISLKFPFLNFVLIMHNIRTHQGHCRLVLNLMQTQCEHETWLQKTLVFKGH